MKRIILLFFICSLLGLHGQEVFSIVAHPGGNAACEANISWASLQRGTYIRYATLRQARSKPLASLRVIQPCQEELCTTYDSIYSKSSHGENIHEYPHFIKCGAVIQGLKKDNEYAYFICGNQDGREVCLSTLHRFKTAGAREWSATIISDFHSYTPLPQRLKAAMSMIDRTLEFDPSTDFILQLGDVVAWGGSYSFWQRMYEEPLYARFSWAGLNGNHDNMSRKYQLTNQYFKNATANPLNGYEGEEGVCYHFTYGNTLFVMLNSESMRDSTGLAKAQEWARKVLKESDAKFKVVCEHYQWFFGENGKTSQYRRWKDLFEECGVDLALGANISANWNTIRIRLPSDGTRGLKQSAPC